MLYRELYTEEMEHREQLRNAVAIPIALLSILGGALAYLWKDFSLPHDPLGWWLAIAGAGALIAFVVAIVFLGLSYHWNDYERIPFPTKIKSYEDGVRKHFGETDTGRVQAASHVEAFLRDAYTKAADLNAETNLNRSAYLYRANRMIIIAFVLVGLAVIPHIAIERLATCQSKGSCNAGRTSDSTGTTSTAPATSGPAAKHRVP